MEAVANKKLTKAEIIATLRSHKMEISALGVKSIGLFGSYARDTAKTGSDIDLLVELEYTSYATLLRVNDFLEQLLKHRIDLIRKGPHLKARFLKAVEKDLIYV